jgi:crotonobetainyl-CoA:carnitine CoA-transferase CaiB-like acyl-CoA transferase
MTCSLSDTLKQSIATPLTSDDFDFAARVNDVLSTVGLSTADSGGAISFYGKDPLIPSVLRFASAAAVTLAAKAVAASAIWQDRGGTEQDIAIDARKAMRRFSGFFEGRWETINGRPPSLKWNTTNPFFAPPFFRPTRDGRHVVALNIYPGLHSKALNLLKCSDNPDSVNAAIAQWTADDLEQAAANAGIVIAKVRSLPEFMAEAQYRDVLAEMPLISIEKIGSSEPIPFASGATMPLNGIRALGMGHVIAGAGLGRDLASFGADVLNVWRPGDSELEPFYWDAQVGMRSTYLGDDAADRATFFALLDDADVFFANRHPGFLEQSGLTAEALCARRKGLVHAQVLLHGASGPWALRPGFDEIGACVSGVFAAEGTLAEPKQPPIVPIVDNLVGWLGSIGVMAALRRRAREGGSYRVRVSLTRTCLWLMSLGLFDKDFAKAKAGSDAEHEMVAPDLFTAETPLGTYQGMTDQIGFSSLKQGFATVLQPMGASKPEWLPSGR